jgi:hypothetical protein
MMTFLLFGLFSVSNDLSKDNNVFGSHQTASYSTTYENVTTHEGDLIIDGTQTYVIENCTYLQTGSIYLRNYGKLIARNAEFKINQTSFWQYDFRSEGYATLELEDTILMSDYPMDFNFLEHSKVVFNGLTLNIGKYQPVFSFYSEACIYIYNSAFFDGTVFVFRDYSEAYIENSTIGYIGPRETSHIRLTNSNVRNLALSFAHGSIVIVNDLCAGFFEYIDLKEKVSSSYHAFDVKLNRTSVKAVWLTAYYDSDTMISRSIINSLGVIMPQSISIRLEGLKPGFYEFNKVGEISLNRTSIISTMDIRGYAVRDVVCTISNSEVRLFLWESNTCYYIINSVVDDIQVEGNFVGSLHLDNTTLSGITTLHSDFYIYGNISFRGFRQNFWHLSNITRNYNIITKDVNDNPFENVELSLFNQNNTVIWNGHTDNLGYANFNLTFTDSNYINPSRLEATKENYSAVMDVGFLSDTPIILKMRYFADLNADGVVNIIDAAIVARAFQTRQGDAKWNSDADLNKDGIINIVDVATVAREFGKTT